MTTIDGPNIGNSLLAAWMFVPAAFAVLLLAAILLCILIASRPEPPKSSAALAIELQTVSVTDTYLPALGGRKLRFKFGFIHGQTIRIALIDWPLRDATVQAIDSWLIVDGPYRCINPDCMLQKPQNIAQAYTIAGEFAERVARYVVTGKPLEESF